MTDDNKFGVSPEDQEILNRLKTNRDKKLDTDDDKIEPNIIFGTPMPEQEKREKRLQAARLAAKKRADEKAMSQYKQSKEDIRHIKEFPKHKNQPSEELKSVKTPPDKRPQIRGKIKPEISYDGDATILTWKRHFTSVLSIPSEIGLVGWVTLAYNTKSKELIIRAFTGAI